MTDPHLDRAIARAVLGIDTLWGGDVMNPSGTGRFIADSWFSDEPLPEAYTIATAAAVRAAGGLSAANPTAPRSRPTSRRWTSSAPSPPCASVARVAGGLRGEFLAGLADCLEVMWDLAMESSARATRCRTSARCGPRTAAAPTPSDPRAKREQLGALLAAAGYPADDEADLGRRGRRLATRPDGAARGHSRPRARLHRRARRSHRGQRPALPAQRAPRSAPGERRLPAHHGRLVLRLDELRRPRPHRRRPPRVRGHLRDQRLARDLDPRVRPAGEPRGGARPRHHLRLCAAPLHPRPGRLRGHRADHEHAATRPSPRASPTTRS